MAFDVVTKIERRGGRVPSALVVSSCNAPHRGLTDRDRLPTLGDSDSELLEWMETIGLLPGYVRSDPDLTEMADEHWDAILDVHLKAPFSILRAVLPHFRTHPVGYHRKVVNISSISGLGGNAGQVNYATAKAGVGGLRRPWPRSGAVTASTSTPWPSA